MARFLALLFWAMFLTLLGSAAWATVEARLRGSASPWDWLVELQRQRELGQQLEDLAEGYARRLIRKNVIVNELISGRLSLVEAAAAFRELNQQPPFRDWDAFRRYHSGQNDNERHYREVIEAVALVGSVESDPSHAHLVEYLEAELSTLLRQGPVCLPPVSEDAWSGRWRSLPKNQ
jgi:hypothetical protein